MRLFKFFDVSFPMVGVVLLFVGFDASLISGLWTQPLGIDWAPLHVAARLSAGNATRLYDFQWITDAQRPEIGIVSGFRPFIYPPSALLMFKPFAIPPFALSYLAWIAVTGALYLAASSMLSPGWWLLLFFPPVVLAGLAGQTGFLIGGLSISALAMLGERPGWAGVLLGVATAVKPQLFVLVPLAFIAARQWRALVCWCVAGAGMIALALALFGFGVWPAWLAALPRFETFLEASPWVTANAMTPYAMAERMGWPGRGIVLALAIPAVALVWATFRKARPASDRLIAVMGGALLLSPYAMNYELMLLAPGLVVTKQSGAGRAILLLLVGLSIALGLGVVGLALALISVAWRSRRWSEVTSV